VISQLLAAIEASGAAGGCGPRTRRAHAGDVAAWLGWLGDRDTGVLAAGRVQWTCGPPSGSMRERRLPADV